MRCRLRSQEDGCEIRLAAHQLAASRFQIYQPVTTRCGFTKSVTSTLLQCIRIRVLEDRTAVLDLNSVSTDPNNERSPFRIFYSWQNDLPDYTNQAAIRTTLRALRTPLEQEFPHLDIEIDEATRKEPGSPNIPATILSKIDSSQVVVADISLINPNASGETRRTPNPNVLFELGYAVAHLGWARIVLLFNEEFGELRDLPFDIDRQRISPYRLKERSDDKQKLQSLCKLALQTIIERNPARPTRAFDPKHEKRTRDLRTLETLSQSLHWPTIETHLQEAPKRIGRDILAFWEGFHAVRRSAAFHIYDSRLLKLIDEFGKHWHETTRFGERYERRPHSEAYVFTYSLDAKSRSKEEHDFAYIEKELSMLRTSMRKLIKYLREKYVELDLEALADKAWSMYEEERRRFIDAIQPK
jgi:hypothetical protein